MSAGLMVATMTVLEFPPRLSFSNLHTWRRAGRGESQAVKPFHHNESISISILVSPLEVHFSIVAIHIHLAVSLYALHMYKLCMQNGCALSDSKQQCSAVNCMCRVLWSHQVSVESL